MIYLCSVRQSCYPSKKAWNCTGMNVTGNLSSFQITSPLVLINILLFNWTSVFEWQFLCVFHFALQALLHLWTGKSKKFGCRTWAKVGTMSSAQLSSFWCCESKKSCYTSSEEVPVGTWSSPYQKALHTGRTVWLLEAAASFITLRCYKTQGGKKKPKLPLCQGFYVLSSCSRYN